MAKSTKEQLYTSLELDYLDSRLSNMKVQIDEILDNPVDRRGPKEVASGRIVENAIIIRGEDRLKIAMDLLERYLKMLPAIEQMREKEEAKQKLVRGDQNLSPFENGDI